MRCSPHLSWSAEVGVSEQGWRDVLAAALAAGGRIVDDPSAPAAWILADHAGNRVCIAAWPDGAAWTSTVDEMLR